MLHLVVVIITVAVNVPLNDAIKAAGDPATIDVAAVREAFSEARWVAWNWVRVGLDIAALAALERRTDPPRPGQRLAAVGGAAVYFLTTARELRRDRQRARVQEWLERGGLTLSRVCPHCGAATHGRPRVDGHELSLAYTPGLVAVAFADVPIGVDVEEPGPAPAPFADRQEWTRAEAVLKLTGEGLRREPWPVDPAEAWAVALPAPSGYVASLAAYADVEVSCRTGTAEELDPPARDATSP